MNRRSILTAVILSCALGGSAAAADSLSTFDDHATVGLTRLTFPFYINRNYGFAVLIPDGQVAWVNSPPSPNHGFRVFIGARRSMEVDASFDTALLGSTSAVIDDLASEVGKGAKVEKTDDDLDGESAGRLEVEGPGDMRRVVVSRWLGRGEQDAIVYTLSLETTSAYLNRDRELFHRMVEGFRLFTMVGNDEVYRSIPRVDAMATEGASRASAGSVRPSPPR